MDRQIHSLTGVFTAVAFGTFVTYGHKALDILSGFLARLSTIMGGNFGQLLSIDMANDSPKAVDIDFSAGSFAQTGLIGRCNFASIPQGEITLDDLKYLQTIKFDKDYTKQVIQNLANPLATPSQETDFYCRAVRANTDGILESLKLGNMPEGRIADLTEKFLEIGSISILAFFAILFFKNTLERSGRIGPIIRGAIGLVIMSGIVFFKNAADIFSDVATNLAGGIAFIAEKLEGAEAGGSTTEFQMEYLDYYVAAFNDALNKAGQWLPSPMQAAFGVIFVTIAGALLMPGSRAFGSMIPKREYYAEREPYMTPPPMHREFPY